MNPLARKLLSEGMEVDDLSSKYVPVWMSSKMLKDGVVREVKEWISCPVCHGNNIARCDHCGGGCEHCEGGWNYCSHCEDGTIEAPIEQRTLEMGEIGAKAGILCYHPADAPRVNSLVRQYKNERKSSTQDVVQNLTIKAEAHFQQHGPFNVGELANTYKQKIPPRGVILLKDILKQQFKHKTIHTGRESDEIFWL